MKSFLSLLFALTISAFAQNSGELVRMHTNAGDIDVQLLPASAPNTVNNFLTYALSGAYDNSIIHRSVKNFVIQGGGYKQDFSAIPQNSPIINEYSLSNIRGTIAMAKMDGSPDSATDQWFFNVVDNSSNLNNNNGGFTVFGRVANAASLAVMDKIAALPIASNILASPFDAIPIFTFDKDVAGDNLVTVLSVTHLDYVNAPVIQSAIGASGYGALTTVAPGGYLEIYGQLLAGTTRGWGAADFSLPKTGTGNAPTQLDSVTVTVGGKNAYVNFVSPTQVNVEISPSLPSGSQPIVVIYNGQASDPAYIDVAPLAAGLLAPSSFYVDGKQYAAATHASGAFISNGKIAGVPAAPAQPGETVLFYGVGFGPVTPNSVVYAGGTASSPAAIAAKVQFTIGGVPALVTFAGLVQGLVGLYQFNVVVPPAAPAGDLSVGITVNGAPLPQSLYLAGR